MSRTAHTGCAQDDEDNDCLSSEEMLLASIYPASQQNWLEKGSIKMMTRRLNILKLKKNDDADEKQTHNLSNRIRNHTSLLVLAVWTLGDHVAPGQQVFTENVGGDDHDDVYDDHDDDNWTAPDRSHPRQVDTGGHWLIHDGTGSVEGGTRSV